MKMTFDDQVPVEACGVPRPALEYGSDRQRVNRDGVPMFEVNIVVFDEDDADVLKVRFPGPPDKGIVQRTLVRCVGVTVTPYQVGERAGVSWEARSVVPITPPGRQAS